MQQWKMDARDFRVMVICNCEYMGRASTQFTLN